MLSGTWSRSKPEKKPVLEIVSQASKTPLSPRKSPGPMKSKTKENRKSTTSKRPYSLSPNDKVRKSTVLPLSNAGSKPGKKLVLNVAPHSSTTPPSPRRNTGSLQNKTKETRKSTKPKPSLSLSLKSKGGKSTALSGKRKRSDNTNRNVKCIASKAKDKKMRQSSKTPKSKKQSASKPTNAKTAKQSKTNKSSKVGAKHVKNRVVSHSKHSKITVKSKKGAKQANAFATAQKRRSSPSTNAPYCKGRPTDPSQIKKGGKKRKLECIMDDSPTNKKSRKATSVLEYNHLQAKGKIHRPGKIQSSKMVSAPRKRQSPRLAANSDQEPAPIPLDTKKGQKSKLQPKLHSKAKLQERTMTAKMVEVPDERVTHKTTLLHEPPSTSPSPEQTPKPKVDKIEVSSSSLRQPQDSKSDVRRSVAISASASISSVTPEHETGNPLKLLLFYLGQNVATILKFSKI